MSRILAGFAKRMVDEGAATSRRSKAVLLAGIAVSIATFLFISHKFQIPTYPHFGGSLLSDANPIVTFIALGVGLLVAVLLSTLIAGTLRFDAGLFCGTLGMAVISIRGGRVGDVLRADASAAATPVIFIHFALELVVLYALISVAWSILWGLHTGGYLKADEFRDGVEDTDEPLIFKISALAMQVGVMALCMFLLAQTDAKPQAIAAVSISAFAGACAAYYMYPISPSPWLWVGPLVVGGAGYIFAYFNIAATDDLWKTGQLTHALAPLARPLPIDYATAGPAAAILAYWMSRRWHRQRLAEDTTPEIVKAEIIEPSRNNARANHPFSGCTACTERSRSACTERSRSEGALSAKPHPQSPASTAAAPLHTPQDKSPPTARSHTAPASKTTASESTPSPPQSAPRNT
jgi:hypothetical protein